MAETPPPPGLFKKYWLYTYLSPNESGYVHHRTQVSDLNPVAFCIVHGVAIIFAIEITRANYKRGIKYDRNNKGDKAGTLRIENLKIP